MEDSSGFRTAGAITVRLSRRAASRVLAWSLCALVSSAGASIVRAETSSPLTAPASVAPTAQLTVQVGQPMAPIKGLDQYNNKFTLSKLRGKWVLIDFSAWWCLPSRELGPWLGALERKSAAAGIPFQTVTVLLEDDVPNGSSNRRGAEVWGVAAGVRTVLYNPYDAANPKTAGLWQAYQAVGGDAVPFSVLVGPDGTVRDVHSGIWPASTYAEIGQGLFDWVGGFTGTSLVAGSYPGDIFDSANVTVHLDAGGDSTARVEPQSPDVLTAVPFGSGVLAAPGTADAYMVLKGLPSYAHHPMEVDLSGRVRTGSPTLVVDFLGANPPAGTTGHIAVSFNATASLPFGMSGGLAYCQNDPIPGPHPTDWTACTPSTVAAGLSVQIPFDLPDATDAVFPYTTDWQNALLPIRTHLEFAIDSGVVLPGKQLELLVANATARPWDPKAIAWLGKVLTKSIRGVPNGKACKKLDAIAKKVGIFSGVQIPQPDATQLIADLAAVKAILPCTTASTAVTTTTVVATTSTTTSTLPTSTDIVCCDVPGTDPQQVGCGWDTVANCYGYAWVNGAAGSVCDGATGKCLPTASTGPCCQVPYGAGSSCGAYPALDPTACTDAGGTYFASAVCGADGTCQEPQKRIFASSTTSTGNLGGLAGADTTCANLAAAAGLPGSYKAWLSTSGNDASARLTHATVPYYLVDGSTKVANDWSGLTSGSLLHAIDLDEHGISAGGQEAWTGTTTSGLASGTDCAGWTSGVSSSLAVVGVSSQSNFNWTSAYYQFCDRTNVRLYCVQQ